MRDTHPPTLPSIRLIPGGAHGESTGLIPQAVDDVRVVVQPPLTRRPGDHLELISFDQPGLKSIRIAARDRRLCPETGAGLVLERALVLQQFRAAGLDQRLERLDHASRLAGAQKPLWDAQSAYLRHLLGHTPIARPPRPLDSPRVAVPVRLLDRLCSREPELGGEPSREVAQAVAWEIAAVLAGETMAEWAYRQACMAAAA